MLIYMLRHGAAEAKAATDPERSLTRDGILQTRSTVNKFRMQEPVIDKAIMSPYQRARQTASVMRVAFPGMRFDVDKNIVPNSDVYAFLETLENSSARHILMVSHNPFLSNLLAVMIDATMESDRSIETSTLVCVMMDFAAPGCGQIMYTLEP